MPCLCVGKHAFASDPNSVFFQLIGEVIFSILFVKLYAPALRLLILKVVVVVVGGGGGGGDVCVVVVV